MSSATPFVVVSGLGLSRGGREVFTGVDFELGPGALLLLRGPNGAGKSSLLLTLAGVLRPAAGTIAWAGAEAPPLHILAHSSGVKTRLTLAENLDFWRVVNGGAGMSVPDALERVGLGGLETIPAAYLSAGQTRRLALARLLVTTRSIWLLDEPLAALDDTGAALVTALLAEHLAAGGAAIAATHDDMSGATGTLILGGPA